jgi:tetratricopeptide (TPR) repeat protein
MLKADMPRKLRKTTSFRRIWLTEVNAILKKALEVLGAFTLLVGIFEPLVSEKFRVLVVLIIVTFLLLSVVYFLVKSRLKKQVKMAVSGIMLLLVLLIWINTRIFSLDILHWAPTPLEQETLVFKTSLDNLRAYKAGLIHYSKRQYDLAKAAFLYSSDRDELKPYSYNRLANVYRVEGRYDSSIHYFKLALETMKYVKEKDDEKYLTSNSLVNMGWVYRRLPYKSPQERDSLNAKAVECFDLAIENDNNNAKAWYGKGQINLEKHEFDAAKANYLKAVYLDPEYAQPTYNLACIYALENDSTHSLNWLKSAIRIDASWAYKASSDSDFTKIRDLNSFKQAVEEGINRLPHLK